MEQLVNKYAAKLAAQGLCETGVPLICGLDMDYVWNRNDPDCAVLEQVLQGLNINSILLARPAEPYFSMIQRLVQRYPESIQPEDSETRTFLHDIPVTDRFAAETIIPALKRRKIIVVKDHGIVSFGTVSPEQAFVTFSSVCFACTVKFFADHIADVRAGRTAPKANELAGQTLEHYRGYLQDARYRIALAAGPFSKREDVIQALIAAGRATVDCHMVDSFFGNISYRFDDIIFISQTGSSMDELAGCIDACPLDKSSCVGLTASSEFTAHRDILTQTDNLAILHGHPKFAVVQSLLCEKKDCENKGKCHIKCKEKRRVNDVPIVPGEVGTGPHGLCHTLPPAIKGNRGVIVYGHGLFTVGRNDFTDAFNNLVDIELMCVDHYQSQL